MGLGAAALEDGLPLAGSFISGILNYYGVKDTNKQNYALYQQGRKDTLAQNKIENKLAGQNFALNKRAQEFAENEAILERAFKKEERGYGRMQTAYARGAQLMSQGMSLNQAKASPFQKYARTA